ncbi:hypothetical protein GT022_06035 [Agaribacter marinus]|uniref:Uncharacterized protein n=1 Tax=Virgibacillus salarius TaxID=447199 RepID=A0A941DS12_9BACI|nr:hypothetical protein [Virgibacillus salarius]MBR7795605.1 hypothetical protein [Virgibacillus salarius]NAZ08318.1 hypothetical protein [Agaribacter marinus]WBX81846.1 hypothetical protein PD280_09375 [Virgibacillus salarius]
MSIKAAVLLHASFVEPDNSEGRPLQLLWEMFDLKIHFFERVLLKKLAEGQTPRKGSGQPEWWSSSSYYSIIATRGSVNLSI